ncbi:MAG: RNA polymerase sigma factor (sigma-70 family) [Planctomycetota bacterium]|jgi:RNA polymerase sigma factor (sigma-70 family)
MSNSLSNAGPRAHDLHRLIGDLAWVQRLAFRLCSDAALAEDLRQDAAVAAFGRTVPAEGPTRRWLAGVVRKSLLMRGRSGARRSAREAAVAEPESGAPGVDLLERAETQATVTEAVMGLREPYRTAILQRYFDEWTPREMAERTGTALDTVKSRLKRGLALLETELGARFGEGQGGAGRGPDGSPDGSPKREWLAALLPLAAMESKRRALLAAASGGTGGAVASFSPWFLTSVLPMFAKLLVVSVVLLASIALFMKRGGPTADAGSPARASDPEVSMSAGPADSGVHSGTDAAITEPGLMEPGPVEPGRAEAVLPTSKGAVALVTGSVIDDRGQPIPLARISVLKGEAWGQHAPDEVAIVTVRSGASGRFSLEVSPSGTEQHWLRIEGGRFHVPARIDLGNGGYLARLPLVPGANDLGTVVLGRAGAVTGTVLDAAGLPAQGATVEVVGQVTTQTDQDGRFDLVGLLPGSCDLGVYREACLLEERELVIPSGVAVTGLQFRLQAAPVLKGQVFDHVGKPVTGAQIELTSADGILVRKATTATSGAFSVHFTELAEAELRVRAKGYEVWDSDDQDLELSSDSGSVRVELSLDEEPDGEEDMHPAASGVVEGRIVRGGKPLPGALIQVARGVKVGKAMRRLRGGGGDDFLATTSLPSLVRVQPNGAFRVEGLEPGLYRLTVLSWSTSAYQVPLFELADAATEPLGDIEIPDGGTVRGRVLLPTGVSPLGLEVTCGSGAGKVHGVLDDGGGFELKNVGVGQQIVELEPRSGELDYGGEVEVIVASGTVVDVEIDATDLGLVELRLDLDLGGESPDGYRIMLMPVDDAGTNVLFTHCNSDGKLFAFVRPVGEVRVYLVNEDLESIEHPTARLNLVAGQPIDKTLAFRFGTLQLDLGSGRTIPASGNLVISLRRVDSVGETKLEIEFEDGEPIDLEESAGVWQQRSAGAFSLKLNHLLAGSWEVTATMEDLDEETTLEEMNTLTGPVWIDAQEVTVLPR